MVVAVAVALQGMSIVAVVVAAVTATHPEQVIAAVQVSL
jgi:hypothetical protein